MNRNYKQVYALLNQYPGIEMIGINELKCELVSQISNNRTQSMKGLSDSEFRYLVSLLKRESVVTHDMDKKRKRVIKSIGEYFKLIDKPISLDYIKAVAVRASGSKYKSFNKISGPALLRVYNEFRRKQEVVKNIGKEESIAKMDPSLLSLCGIQVTVKQTKGAC